MADQLRCKYNLLNLQQIMSQNNFANMQHKYVAKASLSLMPKMLRLFFWHLENYGIWEKTPFYEVVLNFSFFKYFK